MRLDHLLCLTTTWPEFSLIDESPGQKGLDKQDAVFIVKNSRLGRIDGLELVASIHIQVRIQCPIDPHKQSILIQSTVWTIVWIISILKNIHNKVPDTLFCRYVYGSEKLTPCSSWAVVE
jgi:hypothetical protein